MEKRRIVITGLGVISGIGVGREVFFENIIRGVSGIRRIASFDTGPFKAKLGAEAVDFKPEEILGAKGLRTFDRSIKLACSAAKLALDDSGIRITEDNARETGVALGSTLGSVSSICDFDKEALTEGVRYVNPALFPNTVINSPASQVSIKFNIKGFNITVATGFSAGLDAINYGLDALRFKRAKAVLCGGMEEFCIHTFLGFYKAGCLAGTGPGSAELSCPFDRRRNGVILGEGAGIIVLEDLEAALERKARIYAEVLGFGASIRGLRKSMQSSLEDAGLGPEKIDHISAAANSTQELDLEETLAIEGLFGKGAGDIPVSAVKSMLGECYSASGALQAASAIAAIEKQTAPPTINYSEKDSRCALNYAANKAQPRKIEHVMINAAGASGNNSSLIIAGFKGY
ncbi:MAG: beta-ketoacyl-[acyl-carrier-protein] synthase family protein [Candidatus Omnitrophota bacterium]